MSGFSVDLTALSNATQAILDTMDQMATTKVADLQPAGSSVGHDGLADRLGEFCRRWNIGVENLEKDVNAVVGQLVDTVRAYSGTDEAEAANFGGVIGSSTGADPGA
ncbi:hypothetical protein [Cellulomonas sp. P5_E12]